MSITFGSETTTINSSRLRGFLDRPKQLLINGKWVDSNAEKSFKTYNPATGEVLAEVEIGRAHV